MVELAAPSLTGLPHCGQKKAFPRTDAPQTEHRRAISGSIKTEVRGQGSGVGEGFTVPRPLTPSPCFSYSMHRVEEVFALRVDADAVTFASVAKTFFERGGGFFGA